MRDPDTYVSRGNCRLKKFVRMQASPTSAGCEEEGKVVCRGGHIRGQPGTLIIHFPTSVLLSLLAVAGIHV